MQAHPLSSPAAWNTTPPLPTLPPPGQTLAEGAGLAHDAGNLLGALGLYCDLLDVPGILRPEHRHYAREIRMLSQRGTALITRLLEGSPVRPTTATELHCPAQILRELTPLLHSMVSPEATLRVDAPAHLPALPFAAEVLERILVNLTRNAATAIRAARRESPGPAEVSIGLQLETAPAGQPRLRLTVADTGGGMHPSVAAAFVSPAPLPPGARRGLGHRIVHELLTGTGGSLSIKVASRRGTTLSLCWNLAATSLAPRPTQEGEPAC